MRDEASPFEDLWSAQQLDRVSPTLALGETVTARTFAAAIEGPAASNVPSFTAPPLPSISMDQALDASEREVSGRETPDPTQQTDGADLVVLDKLGEGGMGVVLLARQRSLSRDVAVKVLKPAVADEDGARALLREAVVMGGIEHPNIVPVHLLGRDSHDRPVLVMKRIDGTSWHDLARGENHPRWKPLLDAHGDRLTAHLEVLMRVADAAHFAHSRGVVHRDIKPDNVMVGSFGEVYLVDWGIALRLDRDRASAPSHGIRGTPTLMAPEMVSGDPSKIDARTDVYLLGATLQEVLTGTPRHAGESLHAVLFSAYQSRPIAYSAEVPEELAALCNDATAHDPARRPQSAQEFRRRIAEHLSHRASLTLSATASSRLAELETAVAEASLDDASTRRLGTEARFGFAQSLVVWADNPRAREGLARTLRALLTYELARENLDAARALARELDDDTDATRARLDALARELNARREREAAALREAHEADLSVGSRDRLRLMAFLLVAAVVTSVGLDRSGAALASVTRANAALLAIYLAAGAVGLRRVLVNRINRQSFMLGVLCFGSSLAHRLLLLATGASTPIAEVLAVDELMFAVACGMAALALRPWMAWMSVCGLIGALLCTFAPERASLWFTLTSNAGLFVALYFGWTHTAPRDA